MENAMMIALSRQMTLKREMDITANNIANMSTAGFKVEKMLLKQNPQGPAQGRAGALDGPRKVSFVQDWGLARDFSTGQIESTGRPLDVALKGRGFFVVDTDNGARYTRNGRLTLDDTGTLTTSDGKAILDDADKPIVLTPGSRPPVIDADGSIMVDGALVATLKIVDFENLGALKKDGAGRYEAPAKAAPQVVDNPKAMQGSLERSNVVPIMEMNRMIQITRAYQSVSNMLNQEERLNKQTIERLGRVR